MPCAPSDKSDASSTFIPKSLFCHNRKRGVKSPPVFEPGEESSEVGENMGSKEKKRSSPWCFPLNDHLVITKRSPLPTCHGRSGQHL